MTAASGSSSGNSTQVSLQWALQCTATIAPVAAALVHAQLSSETCSALPAEDVQASWCMFQCGHVIREGKGARLIEKSLRGPVAGKVASTGDLHDIMNLHAAGSSEMAGLLNGRLCSVLCSLGVWVGWMQPLAGAVDLLCLVS